MRDHRGSRGTLLGSAIAVALATACSASPPTATNTHEIGSTPIAANHGQPDKELPFSLSGDAVLLGQDFAPDFGPPVFGRSDFGGRCSVDSDFVIRFAIEGEATFLGRLTATAEHCSQIDFTTGLTTITDGEMVITSAYGDELWASYDRTTPGAGEPEQVEFTGGTGQFVGASGGGLAHPICDRATGTCTYDLEGVIVHDASDQAL